MAEFRLLGGVEALQGDELVDLGHSRQRGVLGVLLAEANRPVTVERLLDRVWGAHQPRRGRATLYSYLSRLRTALAAFDGVRLERRAGYRLVLDDRTVDLHRFHDLLARARSAQDDEQAAVLFEHALALWKGEAVPELDTPWAIELRATLDQLRLAAELDHADVALRHGRHSELLPDLIDRAAHHPLDERLASQVMTALYRNGRQADALEHYQAVRERLAEELGTDPSSSLQQLHQRILTADTTLVLTYPSTAADRPVPRQLPPAPPHFTGRAPELAALSKALDTVGNAATVAISAVGGSGGIGKTWLALTWAHRHADRFPDGQLFVDLRGFSPESDPMDPAVAVRGFLDALGFSSDRIPADPHAQGALYRSLVADRQMLIVLDNAATNDQVGPLLPGGSTCTVLVTSRHRLPSLIATNGAQHLHLDVLSDVESRALLSGRLGKRRVSAEPRAVDELIALCGGFPLALGVLAAQAHTHPTAPLNEYSTELRELGVDALVDDDPTANLPTVLSWSLRGLTAEQRQVFALSGIAPGPDIALPAVASLTGLPDAEVRKMLRRLEDASLIERTSDGRYHMHDLIRAYASTIASDLTEVERETALRRVVDFYLHTAFRARHLLNPRPDQSPQLTPLAPGARPCPLPGAAAATAWFDVEHSCLLAAQDTAAMRRWDDIVWQLAWTLITFHDRRGLLHDAQAVWRTAVDAAEHLPEPANQVFGHRRLGLIYALLGRHEHAIECLNQALSLAEQLHDTTLQAHTHFDFGRAYGQRGDDRQALRHARHALELCRVLGEQAWEADALNGVGWHAARLGDYDTAREHCQAALNLHRKHSNPAGEAATLDSLGYIEHHSGHDAQAVDLYRQAVDLLRDHGNIYEIANTLDGLARPQAALGEHGLARSAWLEALQLYQQQERHVDAARVQRQLESLG
ncbi:tetratricopeptide repeat protein [Amycolatopsis sp. FBCC-B4732]|uniref:AfsR/SARP family transcriptional regulator n=1 Tax=Amycolatopsis sp. FBCC-B4732 TaxID=3079339 RepID=UPI001FF12BAD|nr:AfsR/SARP family transcriptional regulator [Amycolatopsis sp. FBCC-B4732]UOX85858.1 tetratricopeptide repeat protein [Amycolatopsis sp. FBCC-B4732]